MSEVPDEALASILPALDEAARAHLQTVERFVAPRPGIVEQVASRRHQFVLGRRGVGKSMLLRAVEKRAAADGTAVVFIDLETLRGIPYPDVLIQLLISVLHALRERIRKIGRGEGLRQRVRFWRVRRAVAGLERELAHFSQSRRL